MKVRQPTFDFSKSNAHWAKNVEFTQFFNAGSAGIPQLERFLNRTLARASAKLDPSDPNTESLRADIRTFIRQEAGHYKNHDAFNEMIARRYDISKHVQQLADSFERLSQTKSLAFLCAYCDGFETVGPPAAVQWLDKFEDLLEGADPEVVRLWKWHLMEEYEHRTVAYDVFKAVHGGYFMRVYGLIYHLVHFHTITGNLLNSMIETDNATMSPAEIKASKKRRRKLMLRLLTGLSVGALKALSPFYSPRNAKEPRNYRAYMAKVDGGLG